MTTLFIKKAETAPLAAIILLLALANFIAGKLGLLLAVPPGLAAVVSPMSGVALGTTLLLGYRALPGTLLGVLAFHVHQILLTSPDTSLETTLLAALGIATGATLQAGAGAYLIKRFVGFPHPLDDERSILLTFGFGGPIACLIAPTIGLSPLGILGSTNIPVEDWRTWYLGDVMGVILFLPLILLILSKKNSLWRKRQTTVGIPMVGGIALSVVVFVHASKRDQQLIEAKLDHKATKTTQQIQETLAIHTDTLEHVARYFSTIENPTHRQFVEFMEPIISNKIGFRAMQWVPRVRAEQRDSFEKLTSQIYPAFQIKTFDPEKGWITNSSKDANDAYPVSWIQPLEGNEPALGIDLISNTPRADVLKQSAETGKTAFSAPVSLVQKSSRFPGILALHPVYANNQSEQSLENSKGFILGVFEVNRMLATTLAKNSINDTSILIQDSEDNDLSLVQLTTGSSPRINLTKQIHIGQRIWHVNYMAGPVFSQELSKKASSMFLLCLGATSSFAFALLLTTGRNNRIEKEVVEQTSRLKLINHKFEELFDANPAGLVLIDEKGIIELVNPSLLELFGYKEEELIGSPVEILVPEEIRERHLSLRNAFLKNPETRPMGRGLLEIKGRRKDGSLIPANLGLIHIDDKAGPKVMGTIIDMSEINESRERLKAHAEELEQSNIALQQFAYVASHDLQTPIRSISWLSRSLQKRYKDLMDERFNELTESIVENTKRMNQLVEDLLNFARVDAKPEPFTKVNLDRLVERVIDGHLGDGSSDATISNDPLPFVLGDAVQLNQLLSNLIGNALKYRSSLPPDIHVNVHQEDDIWEFAVADNGIGMEERHLEGIFEIFRRLHGQKEFPGTGIGLSICKKVVERHHGRIWVESTPGKGSTFKFTLPVLKEDPVTEEAPKEDQEKYLLNL